MQMTTSVEGFICCWQPCDVLASILTVLVCYNVVRWVSSGTNFDYTTNMHAIMHSNEVILYFLQVLAFQKSWRSFSPIIVCILAHCMLPF